MKFTGILYRAINPVYAMDPLSGRGAQRYGGRFNRRGRPALYFALSPETALRESNQVGTLQPSTLVAYDAHLSPLFDARDTEALTRFEFNTRALGNDDWRDQMNVSGVAPTQTLAETLINEGFIGMLVPSYARGATESEYNLVLWLWESTDEVKINVIDDEDRLKQIYE